jgi:hypothetical protein
MLLWEAANSFWGLPKKPAVIPPDPLARKKP